MKRIAMTAFAAVFVFLFGLGAAGSYAAQMIGHKGITPYEVANLIGTRVENPTGQVVGTIQDLVVDSNGRVDFAILIYQFPWEYVPTPPRSVAVPFDEITVKPKEKVVVLNFSGWKLDFAPTFVKSNIGNRKWVEKDYRYFGEQPYWTEGSHTKTMDLYRWGGEAQDF